MKKSPGLYATAERFITLIERYKTKGGLAAPPKAKLTKPEYRLLSTDDKRCFVQYGKSLTLSES